MELFKQEGFEVVVSPIAYQLQPFRALLDRDKTKDKRQAQKELAFIYFYTDYKSEFSDIVDDEERAVEIKKSLALKDKWVIDKTLQEAIDFYKERTTTISSRLLEKMRKGVEKLTNHIETIDFTKEDNKGSLVHDPNRFATLIKTIPAVLDTLKEAENKVLKEREAIGTMRGEREKNIFEDGV